MPAAMCSAMLAADALGIVRNIKSPTKRSRPQTQAGPSVQSRIVRRGTEASEHDQAVLSVEVNTFKSFKACWSLKYL